MENNPTHNPLLVCCIGNSIHKKSFKKQALSQQPFRQGSHQFFFYFFVNKTL